MCEHYGCQQIATTAGPTREHVAVVALDGPTQHALSTMPAQEMSAIEGNQV